MTSLEIRVRGRVQGVGFRPNVHRLARECGVLGVVSNDAEGVLIRASGAPSEMAYFLERIALDSPPLARIEAIETREIAESFATDFRIIESANGLARTEIAPDAVVCDACRKEVLSPTERRFRYPFTTCTHCGPRLSIVKSIPYDRANTTMAKFPLCPACDAEYRNVTDRRFHAEPIACHACGPKARLMRIDGRAFEVQEVSALDDVDAARGSIEKGEIVAIKGLGGYHLACNATREDAVLTLRERKKRDAKPFALMARDLAVIRRYCSLSEDEATLLARPEGPIVILDASTALDAEALPAAVAPGHRTLGFMLPTTPLHVLVFERIDRPVVMTSGNVADAPPITDNLEAREKLAGIADCFLAHDREIENRVDDSVARVMDGRARVLRRSRGYAPSPICLPRGFEDAPPLLAFGAELKSTFCLITNGQAVLSQHQGDLDDPATFFDYKKNLALYANLFNHRPKALVCDLHPEYASSELARDRARDDALPLMRVQHHHAHTAACMAENRWPNAGEKVLGIVLDGLGLGADGELWGGEFLLADYVCAERLATFKPVPMLGGDQASREPWRNLYAHVSAEMGWAAFTRDFASLAVHRLLAKKPRKVLDRMLASKFNSPPASSCGRLFDAVAAAVGIAFQRQAYEGQAGALLEATIDHDALANEHEAYPFSISRLCGNGIHYVEPAAMWRALFFDLLREIKPGIIAARFHRGLARVICAMAVKLRDASADGRDDTHEVPLFKAVSLSGGCFQNRVLFEETSRYLRAAGFEVLSHASVPPNDGGIALGQAVIAAARLMIEEAT